MIDLIIMVLFTTAIITGFLAVEVQKRINSIIWMIVSNVAIGLLFIYIGAQYLGVFQLLIYAGVLAVLFIATANFIEPGDIKLTEQKHDVEGEKVIEVHFIRKRTTGTILFILLSLASIYSFFKNIPITLVKETGITDISVANKRSILVFWYGSGCPCQPVDFRLATLVVSLVLFVAVFASMYIQQYRANREVE